MAPARIESVFAWIPRPAAVRRFDDSEVTGRYIHPVTQERQTLLLLRIRSKVFREDDRLLFPNRAVAPKNANRYRTHNVSGTEEMNNAAPRGGVSTAKQKTFRGKPRGIYP